MGARLEGRKKERLTDTSGPCSELPMLVHGPTFEPFPPSNLSTFEPFPPSNPFPSGIYLSKPLSVAKRRHPYSRTYRLNNYMAWSIGMVVVS